MQAFESTYEINECEIALSNWTKTTLLDVIPDNKKRDVACLLESQRLHNESNQDLRPKFMRMSVPLCRRIVDHLIEAGISFKSDLTMKESKVFYTCLSLPGNSVEERFRPVVSLEEEAVQGAELGRKLAICIKEFINRNKGRDFQLLGLTEQKGKIVVYYQFGE